MLCYIFNPVFHVSFLLCLPAMSGCRIRNEGATITGVWPRWAIPTLHYLPADVCWVEHTTTKGHKGRRRRSDGSVPKATRDRVNDNEWGKRQRENKHSATTQASEIRRLMKEEWVEQNQKNRRNHQMSDFWIIWKSSPAGMGGHGISDISDSTAWAQRSQMRLLP